MSNFMVNAVNKMKEAQKAAIEQLAKYKALSIDLEREIRERDQAIVLFDTAMNPEKANLTMRDVMK